MIKYDLKTKLTERSRQALKDQEIQKYKETIIDLSRLNNKSVSITVK